MKNKMIVSNFDILLMKIKLHSDFSRVDDLRAARKLKKEAAKSQ